MKKLLAIILLAAMLAGCIRGRLHESAEIDNTTDTTVQKE